MALFEDMNKEFGILRYQMYTDDFRNNFGRKTSFYFRFKSARGRMLIMLRVCYFLNKIQPGRSWALLFKLLRRIALVLLYRAEGRLCIEISHTTKIGYGFYVPHPNGIIIHPKVEIGDNCMILQQVTIGNNISKGKDNLAIIGHNVTIGAGAKIIGPCKIGNNVVIGANAVVVKDVPDNCVVAGIPAKKISTSVPPSHLGDYDSRESFENSLLF